MTDSELRRQIAAASREFDVLLRQAAHTGELNIEPLLVPYSRLQPSGHHQLENDRKISLEALVHTICRFPTEFFENENAQIRIVRRLDQFETTPLESDGWKAGTTDTNEIFLEISGGLQGLTHLAAAMCVLYIECQKLMTLGSEGVEECDDLSELAFELGLNEQELRAANIQTQGILLRLVHRTIALPTIQLHADFVPNEIERRTRDVAKRIFDVVAGLGFEGRPLHLYLGSHVITECVSPYARELRTPLLAWARAHPERLGPDLQTLPSLVDESTLYAIVHDFSQLDPRTTIERITADETVGIRRHQVLGTSFDTIELARIDPAVLDARLTHWAPEGEPVLLRIDRPTDLDEFLLMHELLTAFGSSLFSITTTLNGTLIETSSSHQIVMPSLLIRWTGEEKIALPFPHILQPEHFMGLVDPQPGTVLTAPTASLLNAEHIETLAKTFNVNAIAHHGDGFAAAIQDAYWSRSLRSELSVAWPLIGHERVGGRASVHSIAAESAVAIAILRSFGGADAPLHPIAEDARSPQSESARSVFRIRA